MFFMLNNMFENIGEVICKTAKVLFWFFIASGIALFIVYWYSIGIFSMFILPLLVGVGFILLTECLFVFPLYGFGKLVQNSEEIKCKINK